MRDTVVPMFLAIIKDDDEQDAEMLNSNNANSGNSNSWHRYQNAALKKIAEEEIRADGVVGKRQLTRYRFRDHLRVAFRSTLENLVVFPFWAIKVRVLILNMLLIFFFFCYGRSYLISNKCTMWWLHFISFSFE